MHQAPGQTALRRELARRRLARISRAIGWFESTAHANARADFEDGARQIDADAASVDETHDVALELAVAGAFDDRTRIRVRPQVGSAERDLGLEQRDERDERDRDRNQGCSCHATRSRRRGETVRLGRKAGLGMEG